MTMQTLTAALENLARRAPGLHAHIAGRLIVADADAWTIHAPSDEAVIRCNPAFVATLDQEHADYMAAFVAQKLASGDMDRAPESPVERQVWESAVDIVVRTTLAMHGHRNPFPGTSGNDDIGVLGVDIVYDQLMDRHRNATQRGEATEGAPWRDMTGAVMREKA